MRVSSYVMHPLDSTVARSLPFQAFLRENMRDLEQETHLTAFR